VRNSPPTNGMVARTIATALFLAVSACSQGGPEAAASAASPAATEPSVHPESGLKVVPLTVTSQGKVYAFRVEVAASAKEQAQGLMFRTQMGADEGMIFPMDPPRKAAFWMRNTVIPLDLIFVGTDRRILNIAANAVPYDETPLPSDGKVSAVLELNGGRAAELGIGPGDTVAW